MSNYIEYKDRLAFHPGYYIEETVQESGLTQEDFAKRLGTTPKNLSLLVRGKQSLSFDIALKLSKMLGTSVEYWLNLQSTYDAIIAELASTSEMQEEIAIVRKLNYSYFCEHYNLPALPRKLEEQVKQLRCFLGVSSLCYLKNRDFAVSFRESKSKLSEANIVKANVMVQIAVNRAGLIDAPSFNKRRFEDVVENALNLTSNHQHFQDALTDSFKDAGVILVIMPNMPGSKINGATKKLGSHIMLMVNNRGKYADTFWFTLMHEVGHIMNGDFGISFESDKGDAEIAADKYAADSLIDPVAYDDFCKRANGKYTTNSIRSFSKSINRDSGIVVGRLQNDGIIKRNDRALSSLRHKYQIEN